MLSAMFIVSALLVVYLVYSKVTGRWEYKRFLACMNCPSIHLRIKGVRRHESPDGAFLRGLIFFNDGTSFHFLNSRAFDRAVDAFDLRVELVRT